MGYVTSKVTIVQTMARARIQAERAAAVWENADMNDLPRVNAPGLKVWRAVLLELLRRERDSEGEPSVAALARAAGKSEAQARDHLESMASASFIEMDIQRGPRGSDVRLTSLGRLVARILEMPIT